MKQMNLFLIALIFLGLVACSSNDFSAANTTSATGVVATTCATGYVLTNGVCVLSTTTTTGGQTCSTGYGYSSLYGCIPTSACPSGYGSYNGQCVQVITVIVTQPTNLCQDYCPAGYTATDYGCFPVAPGCPACSGLGPDGYCYWASYYLDWLYGY